MENEQFVDELRFVSASLLNKNQNTLGVGQVLSSASIIWTLFRYYMPINLKDNEREGCDEFIFGSLDFAGGIMAINSLIRRCDLCEFNNFKVFERFIKNDFNCSICHDDCESFCNALGKSIALRHRLAKKGVTANATNKKYFILVNYNDIISGKFVEVLGKANKLNICDMIILVDYTKCTMERALTEKNLTELIKSFENLNIKISIVENGDECEEIHEAIEKAKQNAGNSLIFCKTVIGYGSVFENKPQAYLQKLDELEIIKLKEKLNIHNLGLGFTDSFKQGILDVMREKEQKNEQKGDLAELNKKNKNNIVDYKSISKNVEKAWKEIKFNSNISPMEASNFIMGKLANAGVDFLGGGACNVPLTLGFVAGSGFICESNYAAQNINFDDCKNSAGLIVNGLTAGGCRAFYCDKLINMRQMVGSVKRAKCMDLANLYVWTHDGFVWKMSGLESYPYTEINELRAMNAGLVFRPCDANEVAAGYKLFLCQTNEPFHLILASQPLPSVCADLNLAKLGGYELLGSGNRKHNLTLIASGTEVDYAIKLRDKLNSAGYFASVVSMPCEALFARQSEKYQKSVFGKTVVRVFIEFTNHNIYQKYARENDIIIALNNVDANKSGKEAMEQNACDYQSIVAKIEQRMKKYNKSNATLFG